MVKVDDATAIGLDQRGRARWGHEPWVLPIPSVMPSPVRFDPPHSSTRLSTVTGASFHFILTPPTVAVLVAPSALVMFCDSRPYAGPPPIRALILNRLSALCPL